MARTTAAKRTARTAKSQGTGQRSSSSSTKPVKSAGKAPGKAVATREPYSGPTVGEIGTVATLIPEVYSREVIGESIDRQTLLDAYTETMQREAVSADVWDRVQWDRAILVHRGMALVGTDDGFRVQGDYASALGVSPAYLTRLKRLGLIVARYAEVKPGTPEWTRLCRVVQGKAGAVLAPEDKALPVREFRKHLKALTSAATPEEAAKAITGDAGRKPRPNDGSDADDKPDTDKATNTVTTVGDVLAAIGSLEALVHTFSDADHAKVMDRLARWSDDSIARRERLGEPEQPASE